mmetsp:Transcript_160443/g.293092  ORF Transcript_160443/g.293092 Transcript_160443/m.293092 type:complete len:662 (-) Transcript_160443:92-2077(-)
MGCNFSRETGGVDERWLLVPEPEGAGFLYRVRFQRQHVQDVAARAAAQLLELVHPPGKLGKTLSSGGISSATAECIATFKEVQATCHDALADLVVPITSVMLHAPRKVVRTELWSFVRETVSKDVTLAHLFFWALRAVAKAPQAEATIKTEAERLLGRVQGELRGSLPKGTHGTPLITLFDRLHEIGDKLVQVKDKEERQRFLKKLMEQVNEELPHPAGVPILLLDPASSRRVHGSKTASLLRVPPEEAGVLSSKARAPYHVLVEAELKKEVKEDAGWRPCGFCRRRAPASTNGTISMGTKQTPGSAASSSPNSRSDEVAIARYLTKKDCRPKGLFKDETWSQVQSRIRSGSQYGALPQWGLVSLIVKSHADDVRQEELACRLLKWFQRVFKRHNLTQLWLRPFLIIATTYDAGCLEAVPNAVSIDALKKSYGTKWKSLKAYFEETFPSTPLEEDDDAQKRVSYGRAMVNFIYSLAAYSIVCYVLCIRDRHNGNILLDDEGHIIHVDFGFMLCGSPGGKALQQMGGFEPSRGFKLTNELFELLDGGSKDSPLFKVFRESVVRGLLAVREDAQELLALLQLSMLGSENSSMMCFNSPKGYPEASLEDICDRLRLPHGGSSSGEEPLDDTAYHDFVEKLIDGSIDHWRSRLYDTVQYVQNGIL